VHVSTDRQRTTPTDLPQPGLGRDLGVSARVRMVVASALGIVVGVAVVFPMGWRYGLLIGWMTMAAVFVAWVWITIWPMDAPTTARHALQEDPGRAAADFMVVIAALSSLIAVGLLLLGSNGGRSFDRDTAAALSLGSVALAWGAVHTMYTTRYARLYYQGPDGGIDFNETERPCYPDFAYLAFTIGMTFQVSDTNLQTKQIRKTALLHALLSYLFGVVIIGATINLIAGLGH
jgi:uncharacterized membrane protein